MPQPASSKHRAIKVIVIALVLVGLYGLIPQLAHFRTGLQALQHAKPAMITLAVLAIILTYVLSAVTYCLLSFKRLRFGRTLLVELAGLFINRIVPAGLGGISLNFAYLRTNRHTLPEATAVVTLNNGLGFIGHLLVAVVLIALEPTLLSHLKGRHINDATTMIGVGVLLAAFIIGVVVQRSKARRIKTLRHNLKKQLRQIVRYYAHRPGRVIACLLASALLTLANITCLWFCCRALNEPLSFVTVFVVFTLSLVIGTATPTPGGLGGAEAALVAGLVAFHLSTALAIAVTLLYRLISFWLGLLIGIVAAFVVQSRRLVVWRQA